MFCDARRFPPSRAPMSSRGRHAIVKQCSAALCVLPQRFDSLPRLTNRDTMAPSVRQCSAAICLTGGTPIKRLYQGVVLVLAPRPSGILWKTSLALLSLAQRSRARKDVKSARITLGWF